MKNLVTRCAVLAALVFAFQLAAAAQERSATDRVARAVVVVVGETAKVAGEAVAVTAPVVYRISEKTVKFSVPIVMTVSEKALTTTLRAAGGLLRTAVPAGRKLIVTYLKAKLPL